MIENWTTFKTLNFYDLYLTAMTLPSDNGIPRNCAMKIAATASYNAVPSMLIVAPMGSIKRDTCGFTLFFCSKHWIVTGNVAELKKNQMTRIGWWKRCKEEKNRMLTNLPGCCAKGHNNCLPHTNDK